LPEEFPRLKYDELRVLSHVKLFMRFFANAYGNVVRCFHFSHDLTFYNCSLPFNKHREDEEEGGVVVLVFAAFFTLPSTIADISSGIVLAAVPIRLPEARGRNIVLAFVAWGSQEQWTPMNAALYGALAVVLHALLPGFNISLS
jgi:hypothetical protein